MKEGKDAPAGSESREKWLAAVKVRQQEVSRGCGAHTAHGCRRHRDGALWFWCAVTRDGAHSNIQRCRLLLKIRL
jgi:hypothetical protein